MELIQVVVVLIVIGVLMWASHFIPIQEPYRKLIDTVVIIAVVLWLAWLLLSAVGLTGGIRFPR